MASPTPDFRSAAKKEGKVLTHSQLFRILTTLFTAVIPIFLSGPLPAQAQAGIAWVAPTRGFSVALDSADNVYTVDFEQALGAEMKLTKRSATGELLWVAFYDQTSSTAWERASWVAADGSGNAIVCGTLMSGYSNPVEAASIVMKFDAAGNLLWRNVYETAFDGSAVKKCLVDANDNIYVLGMGTGPAGRVTKVKKFAPNGTALWSYFDSAGIGAAVNFKLTPDAGIVITARSIYGSINGYAKIDLAGNVVWSRPGVYSLSVGDSAGDAFGNTYLVHGEYVSGNPGTVVKKLDSAGAVVWERTYALAGFRVEAGSDGHAVVSGFPNAGTAGAAFIKVNQADGALLWQNLDADGPQGLLAHAHMLLDRQNNAYLAAGTMSEMAVCKVNSDGSSGWTLTVPFGYAHAIALAHTGTSVYVVGGTTARLNQGAEPSIPAVPSNLTYSKITTGSIDLQWTDKANNESGFTVERCKGALQFCGGNPEAWSVAGTTTANVTRFIDADLASQTTYSWRVKAFNALGSSSYSNTVFATTQAAVPAAPTDLNATAGNSRLRPQIRLSWTDNATGEIGYTVERCTGATCTNFSPIASPASDSEQYTDTELARSTTYRYRVAAKGNSANSTYSNIAVGQTR